MNKCIYKVAIASVVAMSSVLSASAYEPMLVEGRTWEYYSTPYYLPLPSSYESLTLKGTVDKFGKRWHVLGDSVAFLREENGKVFRLAQYPGKFYQIYPHDSIMVNAGDEFILYDFSAAPQTDYVFPNFYDSGMYKYNESGTYGILRVLETETIKIGDKERVQQYVRPTNLEWENYEGGFPLFMTEGLGVMQYGVLHSYHSTIEIPGSPEELWLARVTDGDGTVVYQRHTTDRMIQEGRVWEYYVSDVAAHTEKFIRYGFKGTTEKYGHTYHNLTDLADGSTVALMREEDYRVWILLDEGTMDYEGKDPVEVTPGTEGLLYDFSSGMFDTRKMVYCSTPETEAPYGRLYFLDRKVPHVEIGAGDRLVINPTDALPGSMSVQGVGTLSGTLCRPSTGTNRVNIRLNNLYDAEGNIIYKGENKAGVEGIDADKADDDSQMFDLMGREIRNPLPGTIYIQGGKKFIAR